MSSKRKTNTNDKVNQHQLTQIFKLHT